jgi:hypothetical protein
MNDDARAERLIVGPSVLVSNPQDARVIADALAAFLEPVPPNIRRRFDPLRAEFRLVAMSDRAHARTCDVSDDGQPSLQSPVVSVDAVARALHVDSRTIRRQVRSGRIAGWKIGPVWVVARDVLDRRI